MAIDLVLYPSERGVPVAEIRGYFAAQPDAFLDPVEGRAFLLCGSPDAVEYVRDARLEQPDRFPYTCVVHLEDERVILSQEGANLMELRSARRFLTWLLGQGDWRIHDQAGDDLTAQYRSRGVDSFYPPAVLS